MVNYNNKEYLEKCLTSVAKMDESCKRNNIEVNVIIVDNNSKDTSFRIINNYIEKNDSGSNIKFEAIWAHSNLGFNLSNNLGIKHAFKSKKVRYVSTLNPDTLVSPEWISTLFKCAEKKSKEERIGMFASEIYVLDIKNKDGWCKTKRKFNFGHSYHDDGACLDIGLNDDDFKKRANPNEIFCHCYAGSLLDRRMFEECGFTDDDYWMFYSCPNLGWKARLKGWNAEFVPDSTMWHRQADTRKNPTSKI